VSHVLFAVSGEQNCPCPQREYWWAGSARHCARTTQAQGLGAGSAETCRVLFPPLVFQKCWEH